MRKYSEDEAQPAAVPEVLLTVTALAKKHGQWREVNHGIDGAESFTASHLAAAVRHGWNHHAMRNGDQEAQLSDACYLAAIKASDAGGVHHAANLRTDKDGPQ